MVAQWRPTKRLRRWRDNDDRQCAVLRLDNMPLHCPGIGMRGWRLCERMPADDRQRYGREGWDRAHRPQLRKASHPAAGVPLHRTHRQSGGVPGRECIVLSGNGIYAAVSVSGGQAWDRDRGGGRRNDVRWVRVEAVQKAAVPPAPHFASEGEEVTGWRVSDWNFDAGIDI